MVRGARAPYTLPMSTVPAHLGRNLRRIRRSLGLTQERFCEATGLSQSYLSELETGKALANLHTLCEHIEALGADPMELVRPLDEETDPTTRDLIRIVRTLDDEARKELLAIARRIQR